MANDSNHAPSSLPAPVLEALKRGQLLEAIKLLRSSGFGLKEAKDVKIARALCHETAGRRSPANLLEVPIRLVP